MIREVSHTFPIVETGHVPPTLSSLAHLVVDVGEKTGRSDVRVGIYLGPQQAAGPSALSELRSAHITGIVNCTNQFPNHHHHDHAAGEESSSSSSSAVEYCNVPVNDEIAINILVYFDGATEFIRRQVKDPGGSVLVHC